jgi:hypothetical protein
VSAVLFRLNFIATPKTQHTTVKYAQPFSKHTRVYTQRCPTQDSFYRTSSGNLPTRTHILAVRKSTKTGTRPASTFFGHKLSFLQSGSFQTHVLLYQFPNTNSVFQPPGVRSQTHTRLHSAISKHGLTKSVEVRRQQSRDHRNVSVSIVAYVTMLWIGPPFELLRC